jgi:hypothetical protein
MLRDTSLRRFWLPVPGHLGIGVTARSRAEADAMAASTANRLGWPFSVDGAVEDVDIRLLDQGHVIPNMAPPNLHGVWFPAHLT